MTRQRKLILEILKDTKSHPTADWIYEQLKKKIPNVSLGTVYRNLRILKEEGEIMELSYGSSYSRYDGNPKNHYHLVCIKCGAVSDVCIEVINEINKQVEKHTDGEVSYHRLEFYGKCKICKESIS